MIKTYQFDVLTKLFVSGATPESGAELRATEIRGALRWWFRVLGGAAGDERTVAEQECAIFGGIAGGNPRKSRLMVRVSDVKLTSGRGNAVQLEAPQNSALGYLLFPLRDVARSYFVPNTNSREPAFTLSIVWQGAEEQFEIVEALITVFGNLGSLGFRSRRCMGALAFHGAVPMALADALGKFAKGDSAITIKELVDHSVDGRDAGDPLMVNSAESCTKALAVWLKGWRSYGPSNHRNDFKPGFKMASVDHDIGLNYIGTAVRPAIGLPIIQRYSSRKLTNDWEPADKDEKRFASPVILRPYRTEQGMWKALVIFVDARAWRKGTRVAVGRRTVEASLDLYNAMKADRQLDDVVI